MKRFRAFFTYTATAEGEAEKASSGSDEGTQAGETMPKTSAHQLQPIRAPVRRSDEATASSPAATPRPPSPSPLSSPPGNACPQGAPASTPTSMLSVSGASQSQPPPHSRGPSDTPTAKPRSRPASVRHSLFPAGDARNHDAAAIAEIRSDMTVNWLYEQQLRKQYASGADPFEGVVLKKARGRFACCPPQMAAIPGSLLAVVAQMNVRCAMTVCTPVVRALLDALVARRGPDSQPGHVPLPGGLRVQVLPAMTDLPKSQLHHFAAFVVDAGLLVVWDDEPEKLLARAEDLEARFVEVIWGSGNGNGEEEEEDVAAAAAAVGGEKGNAVGVSSREEIDPGQLEEAMVKEDRPVRLESACMVAVTLVLWIVCPGLGWRWLAYQSTVDGSYLRLALLAACPAQMFVSLALVTGLFQLFGPISAVNSNSKYYSGKPPRRLDRSQGPLPHVTIQMPVYKEGLASVIKPTVLSLKAAISTYEMQGGTANIFVNDDGMQLISAEDARARRDFYDEHNIGWVARPPHNPNPKAGSGEKRFLRRGKFKKASNMNYALHVSNRVEDKLATIQRGSDWDNDQETAAYQQCLADVLREDEGRTWAEGNIRIGDYILIVDSDTRVPHDCLLDAVSEMEQSPEVAVLQYQSGVMNVTGSFFENGVTWFTRLIYSCITFAVASGDACPFVGHNAVLRWRALQDAAAFTDEDGYEKFWSESHVSEDFDMSLRLQVAGYTLRYASYTGDGFKEGVSLTVYDELARWEKYAYGCNELLFHPLRHWLSKGPFTPLFRRFLAASAIPVPKKLTIVAYIGTYYAIAAAWCITLANYFITGWFYGLYDKYYIDSFAIYISIIVVFTGLGNLALAVLRYRLSEQSLLSAYFENLKWIPMFSIFLGGLSLHLSQAILAHFAGVDMAWGATAKELERVHFGAEAARIARRFKWTFAYCLACAALMACGATVFPVEWRIRTFYSIYPLAATVVSHFALPLLLNPALMMFTW